MKVITELPIKVRPKYDRDPVAWALWRLLVSANQADVTASRPYAIRNFVMSLYDGTQFPVSLSIVLPYFLQSEMPDLTTIIKGFAQNQHEIQDYFERGDEIFEMLATRMLHE